MNFNHLHFSSPDVEATRAFYENYFGFEHHSNLRQTVVLVNEARFFLAIDPLANEPPTTPPSERLHFGFCVKGPEEVRALYGKMTEAGVRFQQELKEISPNALNFYCYDPAGNCVEIGWNRPLV